jgi:hypothetical protein
MLDKLTDAEIAALEGLAGIDDRGSFYHEYYKQTGEGHT